jgi:hypothetical protein
MRMPTIGKFTCEKCSRNFEVFCLKGSHRRFCTFCELKRIKSEYDEESQKVREEFAKARQKNKDQSKVFKRMIRVGIAGCFIVIGIFTFPIGIIFMIIGIIMLGNGKTK